MSLTIDDILDRQVWQMLHGRLPHLAVSNDDKAIRMDRRYGPFAASRDRSPEARAQADRLLEGV